MILRVHVKLCVSLYKCELHESLARCLPKSASLMNTNSYTHVQLGPIYTFVTHDCAHYKGEPYLEEPQFAKTLTLSNKAQVHEQGNSSRKESVLTLERFQQC